MTQKILFVVNNPEFFVSHRFELGQAAVAAGYQVILVCPPGEGIDRIEAAGIAVQVISVDRQNHGWLTQLEFVRRLYTILRRERPDLCHFITLKMFLVGGFAAKLARIKNRVGAISGLGYLFISQTLRTRIFRGVLRPLFWWVFSGAGTRIIFQNDTDSQTMREYARFDLNKVQMIRGSGVDLQKFPFVPEPPGPVVVVMASRLLIDKGVREYVEAARILIGRDLGLKFLLAGDPDPVNPVSIGGAEVESWVKQGLVEWLGHQDDIAELFSRTHIVVLPSYREGFPKVLIEAAACGRAVVTTDVPGCRDAIINEKTGLLVPREDGEALAQAILQLAENAERRREFGVRARELAEQCYSVTEVVEQHLYLYRALMGEPGPESLGESI